jgi:hypothetical protein
VIKKCGDDAGVRHSALITYYGFLSIFPAMLLVVAVTSRILQANPSLRDDLIDQIVPERFHDIVAEGLASMPDTGWPYVVGVIGLLYAGTGRWGRRTSPSTIWSASVIATGAASWRGAPTTRSFCSSFSSALWSAPARACWSRHCPAPAWSSGPGASSACSPCSSSSSSRPRGY